MLQPYSGRIAFMKKIRPNAVRASDVPAGFPIMGKGLGGRPKRKVEIPEAWELTVAITAGGQDYTININAGTGINLTVQWGDGAVESFTTTGDKTHTYSAVGLYLVRITGGFVSGGNIRLGNNAGNAARLKKTSIIPFIPGLTNFYNTFYGCTGLTGAIPTDLFRYNTLVSTNGFTQTFYGCTGLTGAIPTDLFRYNTQVSSNGFNYTFQGCSGLTGAIPADLFRYNTLVSSGGFAGTFRGCTGLTGTIPADLFRYNTLVSISGFNATFYGCSGLTGLPADLFKYNTACTSFNSVFRNCNKLQLRSDLFFGAGEESTRFLNQSVDFTNAFTIGTFTGTQGTAPALWTCTFGTGTPTTTTCFTGQTSGSVTNYSSIPIAWGGPA